ncbi:hypothetical protein QFZ24_009323 [Streptomyces phaeochromogenes]|jgi:hypothetical protein|nr:hypothetical protein [Streptomyces phaeochromogenes]
MASDDGQVQFVWIVPGWGLARISEALSSVANTPR